MADMTLIDRQVNLSVRPRADEMMAVLAHELRNPLAGILILLQSMQRRRSDDRAAWQDRENVERQARQMERIIDDMLDLSRSEHGKLILRRQKLDLDAVVSSAVKSAEPLISVHGHRLSVTLPAKRVALIGDATRLEQILANLLINAAKHTEPGGHIRLCAVSAADLVFIRVKDNGVGIASDLLPHVFEPFRQGPGIRSTRGLGIGLAVVKTLVELHGGAVTAESGGPGSGSEFVVRLPLNGSLRNSTLTPSSPHLENSHEQIGKPMGGCVR